jgi:hypothetical protein
MPTVEGFTPAVLWTTLYGFIALCLLFMIVYKVYDAIRTIMERNKKKKESERPDFAEEVSQKVIDKLEPRFKRIEENLDRDKSRLDGHDLILSDAKKAHAETRDGLVAICKYLMAITQYSNLGGSNPKMEEATAEMTQYLATKIGGSK